MYSIKKIESKEIWNNFVKEQKLVNILSSWEWIEFEKLLGFEVFPYGLFKEDSLKGIFAFRKINTKKGNYLFLRQNTFLNWENTFEVKSLLEFLKEKSKELKTPFFRIAPPLLSSLESEKIFNNLGFKKSVIKPTDAQLTIMLDFKKDLEEISLGMRKNTRYMIRKGEKLGVEVLNTDDEKYLEEFEKIYLETVQRNKWNAESFEYIKEQYGLFSKQGLSRMFVAKYEGEILAIAIFTKFNNQVIYHHSGSLSAKKDIPAMYVLMWEAIKYYKEDGLEEFNFFGVCEKEDTKHSWYGLSLFKRGFGGTQRRLMSTYDFPLGFKYYKTRILEKILS